MIPSTIAAALLALWFLTPCTVTTTSVERTQVHVAHAPCQGCAPCGDKMCCYRCETN